MTGAVLPPELVAVAMEEEIDYMTSKGGWDRFEILAELRQQVKAEGKVLDNIASHKWVSTNKQDAARPLTYPRASCRGRGQEDQGTVYGMLRGCATA